jgi:hypothetical protein
LSKSKYLCVRVLLYLSISLEPSWYEHAVQLSSLANAWNPLGPYFGLEFEEIYHLKCADSSSLHHCLRIS